MMKLFGTRCLLDTNVLVSSFIRESLHFEKAKVLLEEIGAGKFSAVLSSQNILELSSVLTRFYKLSPELVAEDMEKLIADPIYEIIYPDIRALTRYTEFLKDLKIHTTDIFLVATALENGVETIITDDKDFLKIEKIKVYNPFV